MDVRVIAATNKNLEDLVKQKLFREDLYYRLKVVTLTLPPLRERTEDIPLLASHFAKRACGKNGKPLPAISERAMDLLRTYPWPGNIRELEHTIERAVALSNQAVLTAEDLSLEVSHGSPVASSPLLQDSSSVLDGTPTLEELKKRYILHVLETMQRNVSRTAAILAVERHSLYRMLRRYNIPLQRDEYATS